MLKVKIIAAASSWELEEKVNEFLEGMNLATIYDMIFQTVNNSFAYNILIFYGPPEYAKYRR
jgi:TPP-dependent pyruvate/acetoin dehydrogenase alpha subunit